MVQPLDIDGLRVEQPLQPDPAELPDDLDRDLAGGCVGADGAGLGTGLLLQGVNHGGRGCARLVIGRRPHRSPEPAGVVMDRDPAHAARHRLGGDAGHQGDPETGGDEPEAGGPVAGGEGNCWLGYAGPRAELGGAAGTGPDDLPLVCEFPGLDPFPGGEGV